jgi:glycosyltransferase involved in cell wall biosynthesis
MRLSVIVVTRNRAHHIAPCLDSIAAAFARAAPLDAEIVIVNNGSIDNTAAVIQSWSSANNVPIRALWEPRPGKARGLNLALRVARGDLLAFTDDDCRLHPEYVNDLLRHDAADNELVLRGGRVELYDRTDLALTINISPTPKRWSPADAAMYATLYDCIYAGELNGCNIAMRRELVDRLGPFDEDFGPGSRVGSGDDAEYWFRAYARKVTFEYVPDMVVFHHHERKTNEQAAALFRRYTIGWGALHAKYLFKPYTYYREVYGDLRAILGGNNVLLPGFSRTDKLICEARGAWRYLCVQFARRVRLPR